MKTKRTAALQEQVALFREEVIFRSDLRDLQIQSVFIDSKKKKRRAIIIVRDTGDVKAARKWVRKYFKGFPSKVITRKGKPKGAARLETGSGLRHFGSQKWGTFGGVFKLDHDDVNLYGLSNNHVIANFNQSKEGDPIICYPDTEAGTYSHCIDLLPEPGVNAMVGAMFRLHTRHHVDWVPNDPFFPFLGPRLNMQVYKQGFATTLRHGFIKAYNGFSLVSMNGVNYWFENIIAIKGTDGQFNEGMDSGSIVFSSGHYMVGLVFAKRDEYCWALPISRIKPLLSHRFQ